MEPSNLNRQCYGVSHLGMQKTDNACAQPNSGNPTSRPKVQTHHALNHFSAT
ncbi:MAG: hypothetical protein ACLR23_28450 [Clostridia bacterium]